MPEKSLGLILMDILLCRIFVNEEKEGNVAITFQALFREEPQKKIVRLKSTTSDQN